MVSANLCSFVNADFIRDDTLLRFPFLIRYIKGSVTLRYRRFYVVRDDFRAFPYSLQTSCGTDNLCRFDGI